MNTQIKISILAATIALLGACSHKSSSGDAATPPPAAQSLIVSAASTTVAAGATTIVTVTGGSGTYVGAMASYGSIVAATANTFTYTAPNTVTQVNELVTITDSNGLTGNAYITLTGGTGTPTTTTSCTGTYNANVNGTSGTITLVSGSGNAVAGYLYMFSYYYPLYGSCAISGSTGTFSVNEPFFNSTYSGNIVVSGGKIVISGTASNSSTTTPASWTATSTTTLSTTMPPTTNSCQGTYNVTLGTNTGTLKITHDGDNKIAGMITLQGYYYALNGTCTSTAINFTNVTTGSTYTGTVTMNGTAVSLTGTYSAAGTTYNWSGTKQ